MGGKVAEWEAAKASGAERYFTGKPCRNGHLVERYTSNGKCVRCEYERQRRWSDRNLPKKAAYRRQLRKQNPEKEKAAQKRWRSKPEARQWMNDYSREFWQRDLEGNRRRAIVYNGRRRAKVAGNGGSFTDEDVATLRRRQKGKCAICGKRGRLEIDHIIAVARGGSNNPSNLQLLCRTCNASKGSRDSIEWAQERGLLV